MFLILTPCIVIIACAVFTMIKFWQNDNFAQLQGRWLFIFIKKSRLLMEHLPKHRGMANAFLKGDASFKSALMSMGESIDSDFDGLKKIAFLKEAAIDKKEIQKIFDEWLQLKKYFFDMPPEESFTKHSILINKFLEIVEDTAEVTYVNNHIDGIEQQLFNAVVSDIPLLAETLGRARGLGTGVAAQAECSVENRIKLIYLLEKSKKLINKSLRPLVINDTLNTSGLKDSINDSIGNCNEFFDMLQSTLIDAEKIDIEPGEFYQSATGAIESAFFLFDKMFPVVENSLGIK